MVTRRLAAPREDSIVSKAASTPLRRRRRRRRRPPSRRGPRSRRWSRPARILSARSARRDARLRPTRSRLPGRHRDLPPSLSRRRARSRLVRRDAGAGDGAHVELSPKAACRRASRRIRVPTRRRTSRSRPQEAARRSCTNGSPAAWCRWTPSRCSEPLPPTPGPRGWTVRKSMLKRVTGDVFGTLEWRWAAENTIGLPTGEMTRT